MVFKPGCTYHISARTFNNTLAFPTRANYRFFIAKLRRLNRFCHLLGYCLMPDHLDMLVHLAAGAPGLQRTPNNQMQILSRAIGTLLSSYAQAYNKQQRRKGSLFQPKAKAARIRRDMSGRLESIHSGPVSRTGFQCWRLGILFVRRVSQEQQRHLQYRAGQEAAGIIIWMRISELPLIAFN